MENNESTVISHAEKKWPARMALSVAGSLMDLMAPYCETGRVEGADPERYLCYAGSLRRGRNEVGDVEILYVPRRGQAIKPGEMFESETDLAGMFLNGLLGGKLEKRLNINGTACWGNQNRLALHKATGLPVDLFATTPENWWVSLVIRTGSKEFNVALIESARKRGLQLHAYGSFTEIGTGAPVYPKSEREVLELAGMPWTDPQERK